MSAERRRLPLALLLSVLMHTLLLSMTFGGERFGLPGFGFPWRERRIEVPELHVTLVPAKVTAATLAEPPGLLVKEPLQQVAIEPTVADRLTLKPSLTLSKIPALVPAQTEEAIRPKAAPTERVAPTSEARIEPEIATGAIAAIAPAPTVIAVERSEAATFVVPPSPPTPAPILAVAPIASSPENPMPSPRADATKLETAGQESVRIEAARLEAARLEAQRQEDARLAAATLEAQRQADKLAAARMETARVEAAKLDAARQEAARVAAANLEAQRQAEKLAAARVEATKQEAARQEAARIEAARLEAERHEAARLATAKLASQRQEAARQTAVQQAAARQEAARIQEEKEEDARRDARRQAMGRVLNEEAAQRAAAESATRSPSTLPFSYNTARRARLWGRSDPNIELVQYAEAWALKIQFNTSIDTVREVAKRPHTNPMVTVAIRSDGSVESVTFVRSSGVAEVDEAIRRIVQSQPQQAFPPGLAREVDVIEVRRTWYFDSAIRLY